VAVIKIVKEEFVVRHTFSVYVDEAFIWRHVSVKLAAAHASNLMEAIPFSSLDATAVGTTEIPKISSAKK
jgi:hypothetical protein